MTTINRGILDTRDAYQRAVNNEWPTAFLPYVLDDISGYFDGAKTVFSLTINSTSLSAAINTTVIDSKDMDVALDGKIIPPYVTQIEWPWISGYDSSKGFRISEIISSYIMHQPQALNVQWYLEI
jgi:hypothetical protein